tara:strand:- start:487 stop:930 length:444 start_codon:yes stop_codon:yes gene_type:complete
MNLEVHVTKTNMESNPEVTVKFGDRSKTELIESSTQKILLNDIEHTTETKLIVERNELGLYSTGQSHHINNIVVEKVILDDFWEFSKDFYPPTSELNKDYIEHLSHFDNCGWIKNTLGHNTHLFFNGTLTWQVKYPVRRSFFKDFKR